MCILIFTVSPLRPITLPTFLDGTSITTVSTLEEWWIACPENGGEISRILQTWAAAPMFDGWVFLQAGRHLGCLCDKIIIMPPKVWPCLLLRVTERIQSTSPTWWPPPCILPSRAHLWSWSSSRSSPKTDATYITGFISVDYNQPGSLWCWPPVFQ